MVEKVIPESDLNTVLATRRNAILAAKERKSELVLTAVIQSTFDSGLPLRLTLSPIWGPRITTRAESRRYQLERLLR